MAAESKGFSFGFPSDLRDEALRRIDGLRDLPTLPVIVQRVMAMAQDVNVSFRELKQVIIADPPLAAKILKVANSAYYARRVKATSIDQALVTVGLQQVISICASMGVIGSLDEWEQKVLDRERLWRHSLATGFLAKGLELRRGGGQNKGPDIFLCGLLHNIGWIVIDYLFHDRIHEILRTAETTDEWKIEHEVDILGIDHAELGSMFLEKWGLPNEICEIVGNHHQPEAAETYQLESALIQTSAHLSPFRFRMEPILKEASELLPHKVKEPGTAAALEEIKKKYVGHINQASVMADRLFGWLDMDSSKDNGGEGKKAKSAPKPQPAEDPPAPVPSEEETDDAETASESAAPEKPAAPAVEEEAPPSVEKTQPGPSEKAAKKQSAAVAEAEPTPKRAPEPKAAPAPKPARAKEARKPSAPTIMIFEEDAIRSDLQSRLKGKGVKLHPAKTIREGYSASKSELPDLIMMPASSPTKELTAMIGSIRSRGTEKYVPILLTLERGEKLGRYRKLLPVVDDAVVKPGKEGDLAKKVQGHLVIGRRTNQMREDETDSLGEGSAADALQDFARHIQNSLTLLKGRAKFTRVDSPVQVMRLVKDVEYNTERISALLLALQKSLEALDEDGSLSSHSPRENLIRGLKSRLEDLKKQFSPGGKK
ncbi:HDOD domain-containing protein [bacterium]|nr:HDOD domain-containing protein [bacterium]